MVVVGDYSALCGGAVHSGVGHYPPLSERGRRLYTDVDAASFHQEVRRECEIRDPICDYFFYFQVVGEDFLVSFFFVLNLQLIVPSSLSGSLQVRRTKTSIFGSIRLYSG